MGYKIEKVRLCKFIRYISKVYEFMETVRGCSDKRKRSEVKIETVFVGIFLTLLLRWGSIRRLSFEVLRGKIKKFIPFYKKSTFCANTIGYGLENMDTSFLEKQLTLAPKKLKRNKAYSDTIGGLHVVAVDGTEYFRSASIHCDECLKYKLKTKEGFVTNYVHRAVLAQKVGSKIQPILAVEEIRNKDTNQKDDQTEGHYGELTAAKRLAKKVISLYGHRFLDVFTLDALYLNYPFVSFAKKELQKEIIVRVKDERTTLYKEIESLSTLVEPIKGYDLKQKVFYQIYAIPSLHHSVGWDIELRGFKIIEKNRIIENKNYFSENLFFCATTLPKWKAKADIVRKIVHAKWGIENNGIKDLKDNWFMTHNFHHHPNATLALFLILFLVYNLFYAYLFLQMKTYRLYDLTIAQVIEEFIISYVIMKNRLPFRSFSGP